MYTGEIRKDKEYYDMLALCHYKLGEIDIPIEPNFVDSLKTVIRYDENYRYENKMIIQHNKAVKKKERLSIMFLYYN